ncbi:MULTISPECIES: hypothetical protein [unclassified Moraxella]|uniref:hypothetical protein n=1 Tax=unclassified Moraxella TaxID=2685852 RepID=UPI003AF41AE2
MLTKNLPNLFLAKPLPIAIKSVIHVTILGGLLTTLVGCASLPKTNTTSPQLQKNILQAHENLVGLQSYGFDFHVALQPQSVPLTHDLVKSPSRDKLLTELINQQQLNSQQRELMQAGINHQSDSDIAMLKTFQAIGQKIYYHGQGVVDMGAGRFSIVPEWGYRSTNANANVKLPLAVDLRQAKIYADISMLSTFVTNPKYDGRYVAYDYGQLFKKMGVDTLPLLRLLREFTVLTPTLAKESDYQLLPLTAEDQKQGIAQRVAHHVHYEDVLTSYVLFIYLNQKTFGQVMDKGNLAEMSHSPIKQLFDKNSTVLAPTLNEQALQAAERMNQAINELQGQSMAMAEEIEETDSETEDATQMTAETENEATAEDVSSDSTDETSDTTASDEAISTEQAESYESSRQAIEAFDKYKSDKLITAKALADIIRQNPESYAKLRKSASQIFASMGMNDTANSKINYLFNKNNQLVRIESIDAIPNLMPSTSKVLQDNHPLKMQSVLNFYDYGKAKVDPAIFKNAVSFEEATKEDSLWAMSKKSDKFDKQENLEQLANSLIKKNSYQQEFVTLYVYQYLLKNDEEKLNTVEMAKLQATAQNFAMEYAVDNDIPTDAKFTANDSNNDAKDDTYTDEDIADTVDEAVYQAYLHQQKYLDIQQQRQKGVPEAKIFAKLYEALKNEVDEDSYDDEYEYESNENESDALENVPLIFENDACSTLLDSDSLDKQAKHKIQGICQKIESTYQKSLKKAEAQQANQLAKQQKSVDRFEQMLAEVAIEDMKTHKTKDENGDNVLDERLIKKIEPYIEGSHAFNQTAYQKAYQLMLE